MYDQTSAGREREMDVGTAYDPTSRSTDAGTGTGTGYPAQESEPGYAGTAYPETDYTDPNYPESGYTDPGATTIGTGIDTTAAMPTDAMPTAAMPTDETTQIVPTGTTSGSGGITEQAATAAKTGAQATSTAARDTAQTAKEGAREVAQEVSAQARGIAGDLREQLVGQAHQQHDTMVSKLRAASDEMRQMAQNRDQSPATSLVRSLAERTHQFADQLETRGPEGVLSEVQEFARRKPGTFLLAAAAAGFVVGRLGKSVFAASSDTGDTGDTGDRRDYQAAYRAGTADTTAGLRGATTPATASATATMTGATTGTDALIRDEGGWNDPRPDAVLEPSTVSGGTAEPGGPIPAVPPTGPATNPEGGRL